MFSEVVLIQQSLLDGLRFLGEGEEEGYSRHHGALL